MPTETLETGLRSVCNQWIRNIRIGKKFEMLFFARVHDSHDEARHEALVGLAQSD